MNREPDTTSMDTVDLVRLAKAGERDASDELFARYASRVLGIVRMRLGGRIRTALESTDIRQEVLADAYRDLANFEMRDESSLIRWLSRCVENVIRARARYLDAEKRRASSTISARGGDADDDRGGFDRLPPSNLPTPSVEIGRAEATGAVRDAISELSERHREAILLRDYAGCSWEEVGLELGLSANAARMLRSRALAKLGKRLRERGID